MKYPQFLFLSVCCLLFFACEHSPLKKEKELEDELEEVLRSTKGIGAAVILTQSDSVIFQKYLGYANLEEEKQVDSLSLFGVGSISKTFTSLAILKLIEEGKFELEDRISDILPALPLKNKWRRTYPLKLIHILEHTSGFDDLHPKNWSYPVEDDNFGLDKSVEIVRNSMIPRWEPGTRFSYSNVNYLLAGYIVDTYSPQGYDAYLRDQLFSSLGMENSTARSDELDPKHLAKSYYSNRTSRPFKHIIARPAGSIFSSAEEMGKFMRMLLKQPEDFLSVESYKELEKHHSIAAFEGTENGFRLGLQPTFRNGHLWLGHGGAYNNYKSVFKYNRDLDLGIFIVSNGPHSVKTLSELENKVFKHVEESQIKDNTLNAQPTSSPEKYTGYYSFGSPRSQLMYPFTDFFTNGVHIRSHEGRLFMSGLNQSERPLYPKGEGRFSFSSEAANFNWIFPQNKPGTLYSSLGFHFQKRSYSGMMLLAGALIFSLLIVLSSQLVIPVKVFNWIKGKGNNSQSEIFLLASSSLFLLGVLCFLNSSTLANPHKPQFTSILLYISSLLFPFLASAGLFYWLREGKELKRLNWTYQGILGLALLFISGYLYYWDMLGFAYWSY